jgi:5-methylcytosine-specific restriction protein A
MSSTPDYRSPEAQAYRHLYRLAAWQHTRRAQLDRNPLCEKCQQQGLLTPANVVNHRKPHRGDMRLFLDPDNLESTCKPHHDGAIQSFEKTGIERGCDANGIPIDKGSHWHA